MVQLPVVVAAARVGLVLLGLPGINQVAAAAVVMVPAWPVAQVPQVW
ncbi:hypothetical protein HX867_32400 [Pseudomonas gingeri]|nr:hypothetical protein [Pseudomonas gingeri]NVZ66823.1 hypothetical protein [Pseudomonas gingeri]